MMAVVLLLAACSKPTQQPNTPSNQPQTQSPPTSQPAADTPKAGSRLDTILQRGTLICGVNNALAGFGFLAPNGTYSGFDVDFCRSIAAALFNDPNKVEFRPLNAAQRFTAVQTGEVDVLIRNTSWTVSRDSGSINMEFAPTTFYDGQGMMVRKDSGIQSLADFGGRSVCVQSGTTTELNLADTMRKLGVTYESVVVADLPAAIDAYEQDRCDGFTTDRSGLVSQLTLLKDPSAHMILAETMSKEPLAPAVLAGDAKWFKVVKWVTYAVIEAEELGINSKNADDLKANSTDPAIQRFMGIDQTFGEGLGISNDWAYRAVKHVGNYAEIYDRNLGPATPFNLPRGLNSLWSDGGMLYAPPIR